MKEFQLNTTTDKSSGTTNVSLQGKLDIANIADIHSELLKILKGSKKIVFELKNFEEADVSTVQLLKAFKNTCTANKVEVNFSIELSEDTESLFSKAGFSNIFK